MPEESYSFTQARLRLEEIVTQVRKKDVSLETSLDLLEEGVRLANQCTELIDSADWEAAGLEGAASAEAGTDGSAPAREDTGGAPQDAGSAFAAHSGSDADSGIDADSAAEAPDVANGQAEPSDLDEV